MDCGKWFDPQEEKAPSVSHALPDEAFSMSGSTKGSFTSCFHGSKSFSEEANCFMTSLLTLPQCMRIHVDLSKMLAGVSVWCAPKCGCAGLYVYPSWKMDLISIEFWIQAEVYLSDGFPEFHGGWNWRSIWKFFRWKHNIASSISDFTKI